MSEQTCGQCGAGAVAGARFCPACGATLAGAPPSDTQPHPSDIDPPDGTPSAAEPQPDPTPTTADDADTSSGSSRRLIGAGLVVVGLVALAGIGWYIVQGVSGESGGASSPEAAVESLVTAINQEDPTGAMAALAPDEVRTLADLLSEIEGRAQGAALAGESSPYSGFDLEITDVELSVEELSDNAARVDIDDATSEWQVDAAGLGTQVRPIATEGTYTGEVDRDDLTYADAFYDYDADREVEVEVEPFLIAVKRNGGWYVSPYLTAMAWLAEALGLPEGDFDVDTAGLDAADTPEEALVELVDAADELDPEALQPYLPTNEFLLLAVYEDAIEDLVDELTENNEGFTLDVDDSSLRVDELSGGRKRVAIEEVSGDLETVDYDGYTESFEWEIDGLCLTVTDFEDSREACLDDAEDAEELLDVLEFEELFVVVEQDRGGWVVSPMATMIQYGTELLPKLSDPWIHLLLGIEQLAPADAEAIIGEPTDVSINEAGYAVVTTAIEEGQRVLLTAEAHAELHTDVYGPDLDSVYGELRGDQVEQGGQHTLVLHGDAGDTHTITLKVLEVQDLGAELTAEGTLSSEAPVALYRFQVSDSDGYVVETAGGNFFTSFQNVDESYVCSIGSRCDLDAGSDYFLRLSSRSDEAEDYSVTIEPAPGITIDNGDSASGYVTDGGRNYHSVEVPSGSTASVYMTWDTSPSDLDLFCSSRTACDGSAGTGRSEEIIIDGPFSGEIEVYGFSGGSDYDLVIIE